MGLQSYLKSHIIIPAYLYFTLNKSCIYSSEITWLLLLYSSTTLAHYRNIKILIYCFFQHCKAMPCVEVF